MNTFGASPTEFAAQKNVLFITTKNLDYIRNVQEISCLRRSAGHLRVVGCKSGNTLSRIFRVWLRLLFLPAHTYDLVFIGFAPQLVLPFWKWKFKKHIVAVDFFISFYDTLVFDRRIVRPGSLLAALLHRMDESVGQRADIILADTHAHADYFMREFKLETAKMQVLYLQADPSIYYPHKPLSSRLWPKQKFVVLYFGSILPLQGVGIILQCARKMQKDTHIVFDIIGPVSQKERQLCKDCPNIFFTDWLSQPELAEHIAQADLCLAGHFNAQIPKASRTIPGKAYIYRAMGKPLVLGENPANHELFHEDGKTVYYVKMGDANCLAEKIRWIAQREIH